MNSLGAKRIIIYFEFPEVTSKGISQSPLLQSRLCMICWMHVGEERMLSKPLLETGCHFDKWKMYVDFFLSCALVSHTLIRPKKKLLCCPHPTKIWKLGRSVDFFYFFIFFTYRERVEFSNIFFKFLNGENSGGKQSKRIYKCFFKPLNTNFCKFFAQIWH